MLSKRLGDSTKSMPAFSEAHRRALPGCSRNGSVPSLSRGELAILISRSTRTISRWESVYGIRVERDNARVLRYPFETLVGLVALGALLNVAEAERRGLNPKAIITLASSVAPSPKQQTAAQAIIDAVLIAADEDDLRLIRAWKDQALGPVLRKILRGLTEVSLK